MKQVFLSIGSNAGDRNYFLSEAVDLLEKKAGTITGISSIYETASWGNPGLPSFLNQVIELHTWLEPVPLLTLLMEVEQLLGRRRTAQRWAVRTIDLDILFYESLVFRSDSLQIPHPELHNRRFVLVPLEEIAPDFTHPLLGKSIYQLLKECGDQLDVRKQEKS